MDVNGFLPLIADVDGRSRLEDFLRGAGRSLDTFRYFEYREFDAIVAHICTVLLYDVGQPVGYGHLDPDGGDVWLGICVREGAIGRGYGRRIMEHLLGRAVDLEVPVVRLKVDSDNEPAISLYREFGFVTTDQRQGAYFMERRTGIS